MKRREVTDEMVERACAAGNHGTGREIMRVMLEAALNPAATQLTPQVLFEGFKDGKMFWSVRMINNSPAGPDIPSARAGWLCTHEHRRSTDMCRYGHRRKDDK